MDFNQLEEQITNYLSELIERDTEELKEDSQKRLKRITRRAAVECMGAISRAAEAAVRLK